jgi:hypothetical protein
LLLEIDSDKIHGYGLYGLTLASLAASFSLFLLPREKKVRIAVIGGLGSLVFLGVMLVVAASSRPSRLSAFYSAMVAINCVGGWQYLRRSDKNVPNGVSDVYIYNASMAPAILPRLCDEVSYCSKPVLRSPPTKFAVLALHTRLISEVLAECSSSRQGPSEGCQSCM